MGYGTGAGEGWSERRGGVQASDSSAPWMSKSDPDAGAGQSGQLPQGVRRTRPEWYLLFETCGGWVWRLAFSARDACPREGGRRAEKAWQKCYRSREPYLLSLVSLRPRRNPQEVQGTRHCNPSPTWTGRGVQSGEGDHLPL